MRVVRLIGWPESGGIEWGIAAQSSKSSSPPAVNCSFPDCNDTTPEVVGTTGWFIGPVEQFGP